MSTIPGALRARRGRPTSLQAERLTGIDHDCCIGESLPRLVIRGARAVHES